MTIEHLDCADVIRRYDRPGALFYLDPPYWGSEADYGNGLFERADFSRLAELPGAIQGRLILSIDDRPEIRQLFAGMATDQVGSTYTIGGGSNTVGARELIISSG